MLYQPMAQFSSVRFLRACIAIMAMQALGLAAPPAEKKTTGEFTLIVKDGTGLVFPGAHLEIHQPGGNVRENTDTYGTFSRHDAPLGRYQVIAEAAGFSPTEARFELTAAHPRQEAEVVLHVMRHLEKVEVSSAVEDNNGGQAKGLGSLVLGAKEIAILPDDPDELRARLQMLAAASGGVSGNVAIQTDGFLTEGTLPSKSAIREIRINPDLYSAQYSSQPIFGGGLIEIDTKPSLETVHGGIGWSWDSAALNARDSLAPTRTPLSNNIWNAEFGAPIIKHRLSSFTTIEEKRLNQYAVVDAAMPGSDLAQQRLLESVAVPQRMLTLGERLDLQLTPLNALAFRYSHQSREADNYGAGGLTLPDAASLQRSQRDDFRVTGTSTLSESVLNEARFAVTLDKNWLTPNSDAPAISVAGGFLSGGSGSQYSTDFRKNLEFGDMLSVVHHKHTIRAGVQLLRFDIDQRQRAGFNGQLLFAGGDFGTLGYLSGLDQYGAWLMQEPGVIPTVQQVTQGLAPLSLAQWQGAAYVQDEWQVRAGLSLSMGLRYETQSNPVSVGSLAPRLGLAYSFGSKSEWVARFRFGMFYRRIDTAVALEALRLSGDQTDILRYGMPLAGSAFTILAQRLPLADLKPGRTIQPQLTLERRIKGGTVVQAGYTQVAGDHLLRSESELAPESAVGVADPSGNELQNRLQYVSNGGVRGSVAMVTVNSSAVRHVNFFGGYLYMSLKTNADSPNLFPQSESNPNSATEWAMPAWQSRHRFFSGGFAQLPGKIEWTFLTAVIAGTPFNITTGQDNNQDGIFNDRPGLVAAGTPGGILTPYGWLDPFAVNGNLPRNAGRLPLSLTVDSGLSRRFDLHKPEQGSRSLTVSLRATNLTNHMNASTVNGVLGSPLFLQTIEAGPSRRVEMGLRFSF